MWVNRDAGVGFASPVEECCRVGHQFVEQIVRAGCAGERVDWLAGEVGVGGEPASIGDLGPCGGVAHDVQHQRRCLAGLVRGDCGSEDRDDRVVATLCGGASQLVEWGVVAPLLFAGCDVDRVFGVGELFQDPLEFGGGDRVATPSRDDDTVTDG